MSNASSFVVESCTFHGDWNSSTTLEISETIAIIRNSVFITNIGGKSIHTKHRDYQSVGGAIIISHSVISMIGNTIEQNGAEEGGAIFADHGNVSVIDSLIINNHAEIGGVLYAQQQSNIIINNLSLIHI